MSGSKTAIIVEQSMLVKSRMDALNSTKSTVTSKKDDNKAAKKRYSTPLPFKLKLIEEVMKHDIIWKNLKEKKNPHLIENAWERVGKALCMRNNVAFCEKQWKLLIHGYRSHINRNTRMNADLVQKMDFMSSQLKKSSSEEQSDSEAMEPETPVRNKATRKIPKTTKETKRTSICEAEPSEDQKVSVAILKMLFGKLPPDAMRPVRNSLIEVLISLMPDIDAKISEHAKQDLQLVGDINKIDWSALDIPAEICKAVWDYKVMQVVLNV